MKTVSTDFRIVKAAPDLNVPRLFVQVAPLNDEELHQMDFSRNTIHGISPETAVCSIVNITTDEDDLNSLIVNFVRAKVDHGHLESRDSQEGSLSIPIPHLLMLRAQYRIDDEACIILVEEDLDDIAEDNYELLPLAIIQFPDDIDVYSWEKIKQALLEVSDGVYADDESFERDGSPSAYRAAQQRILKLLFNMSSEDAISSWQDFMHAGQDFQTDEEGNILARGFYGAVASFSLHIAYTSYHAIVGFKDASNREGNTSVDDRDRVDEIFNDIIMSNDLMGAFKDIDAENPYGSNEHFDILNIGPHFDELIGFLRVYDTNVIELMKWDLKRIHVMERAVKEFGLFDVYRALILSILLWGNRHATNNNTSPELLYIRAATADSEEVFPWEFSAFNVELSEGEFDGFSRLLSIEINREVESSNAYLQATLVKVSRSLHEDGWSLDNIDKRLAKINSGRNAEVRSLVSILVDEYDSPHDQEEIPSWVVSAQKAFYMNSSNLEGLSLTTSAAILTLAHWDAVSQEQHAGPRSIGMARLAYINRFINDLSEHVQRKIS